MSEVWEMEYCFLILWVKFFFFPTLFVCVLYRRNRLYSPLHSAINRLCSLPPCLVTSLIPPAFLPSQSRGDDKRERIQPRRSGAIVASATDKFDGHSSPHRPLPVHHGLRLLEGRQASRSGRVRFLYPPRLTRIYRSWISFFVPIDLKMICLASKQ